MNAVMELTGLKLVSRFVNDGNISIGENKTGNVQYTFGTPFPKKGKFTIPTVKKDKEYSEYSFIKL